MKRWHYTSDIHDFIWIGDNRFKLNTAYDNVFRVFKATKDDFDINVFLTLFFFPSDVKRVKDLTYDWELEDYTSLVNHITHNILFLDGKENNNKKYADIDIDSELIFASFYKDYGISLVEKKGKMTWKEFLILFENLSDDTPFKKAVQLLQTPDKELTAAGKRQKAARRRLINSGTDVEKQVQTLTDFLSKTAKKENK